MSSIARSHPSTVRRICAATLAAFLLAGGPAPDADAGPGEGRSPRERFADRYAHFLEKLEKRYEKRIEKLAKDQKKAEKMAEKAEEKQAKRRQELQDARELERWRERQAEEEQKREQDRMERLLEKGKLDPTNVPVVSGDFFAMVRPLPASLGVLEAHTRATGRDVVVAVLDGGFNVRHPAIADRVLPYAFDSVELTTDVDDGGNGFDDDLDGRPDLGVGHGTFVAGMVRTVAPDAWILPVRIADDEGYATEEEVADGIEFAVALEVDVINLSLEAGKKSGRIESMLKDAQSRGIVVVVSAGNGSDVRIGALGDQPFSLVVGATDDRDVEAPFSNRPASGQKTAMVMAPGVDLVGPYGWPSAMSGALWSGTSFSAGLVSGAVALVRQAKPWLAPKQVAELLISTTDPGYDRLGQRLVGRGRINVLRALSR